MNARTTKILAVLVIVLFAAVFLLNRPRDDRGAADELLFPGLKARLDQLSAITIADNDSEVTIAREDDGWIVPEKDGYAANAGALRDLLLAIAEARKLEQKTSNSEFYERLGVEDPAAEGSTGVLVRSKGLGDADFALILGDPVQQEYRYVRVADAAESWLVDKNPDLPIDAGGWLAPGIVDIASTRIRSITITHQDGGRIRLHKDAAEATNFEVLDIPEGRELSYPSVANSVAAALSNLTLEDVRRTAPADGSETATAATATTTDYTTFDGLRIRVASVAEEGDEDDQDETWITLAASAVADGGGDKQEAEETGETPPAAEEPDPEAEVAAINTRVAGWQYRIAAYKADQFTRRWEDLLKAAE